MMNYHRISMALGVLAGALCSGLYAAMAVLEPLSHFFASGVEAMACGVEKLKRELVQHGLLGIGAEERVSSSLRRESNGYRQDTARCTMMQMTPALT